MSVDTADLLYRISKGRGQVIKVPMTIEPDDETYLLTKPDQVQHVVEWNQDNYRKSKIYQEELGEVMGSGLLTSQGELWLKQQQRIRPMFTKQSVNSFADLVVDVSDRLLDRWEDRNEPIDLLEEMEWVTLIIIGEAMFSADMDDHADEIREALRVLRARFKGIVDPTRPDDGEDTDPEAEAARNLLEGIVYELIDARRGDTGAYDDLLSMLMTAKDDETGEGMSDEQIRDEIMTFLLAGHETTAASLTWTWYLLDQHPEVHRRLHEHVSGVDLFDPAEALSELTYAKQCVQEAMRIYPPVPVFSREAIETDEIDGHTIPAGADVLMSQYVVHRDPDVWDDPMAYRPSRFEPGAHDDRPTYSYFPFGGGPRMCIGRQFSLMEARLILARVVATHRLSRVEPPEGEDVGVSSAVTMVPDEPVLIAVDAW